MRIRTIKPEFFVHHGLHIAEKESGLPIRVAFVGLWCAADREGRFKWRPEELGIQILPYDNVPFSRVLDALVTRGFIVKYRVDDAWFGAIPSWQKHQVINNRERASEIPSMSQASETCDALSTREPRVDDACNREGKGMEGKGTIAPPLADAKKPRKRNELLDALAEACGNDPMQVTAGAWPGFAKALSEIKAVCPEVDRAEMDRRAKNYRLHFSKAALTPYALSKHWAECDKQPAINHADAQKPNSRYYELHDDYSGIENHNLERHRVPVPSPKP